MQNAPDSKENIIKDSDRPAGEGEGVSSEKRKDPPEQKTSKTRKRTSTGKRKNSRKKRRASGASAKSDGPKASAGSAKTDTDVVKASAGTAKTDSPKPPAGSEKTSEGSSAAASPGSSEPGKKKRQKSASGPSTSSELGKKKRRMFASAPSTAPEPEEKKSEAAPSPATESEEKKQEKPEAAPSPSSDPEEEKPEAAPSTASEPEKDRKKKPAATVETLRDCWKKFLKLVSGFLDKCVRGWKAFFASLVRKVGYTIAATAVVGVAAGLLVLVLFLSISGGKGGPADSGTQTAGAGETLEDSEANYDGMEPAAAGGWSQTIPGQDPAGQQDSEIAYAFRGLFSRTREGVFALKEQAEESVRSSYLEILEAGRGDEFSPEPGAQTRLWEQVREERRRELEKDPLLILVNKWHQLPEDYEVEPVELPNGQMIGTTAYEPLMEMLRDCEEAGGTPIVCSGYRPHDKQVMLFDEQIERWIYSVSTREEAEALAATAVAIPGTSEHELGLAADIYSSENMNLDESQVDTFTQQWLMENCWKYGFILRYPKDKNEITGIIFEPWHYRYVGKERARRIFDAGICLEEYLDRTDHPWSSLNPFDEAGPEEAEDAGNTSGTLDEAETEGESSENFNETEETGNTSGTFDEAETEGDSPASFDETEAPGQGDGTFY